MLKKHSVLLCLIASAILIVLATIQYPGGSILDNSSPGFNWSENFISNLFAAKAINGLENPGRTWALIGIAFHSAGFAIFFFNTANKMPSRHAATVLKLISAFYIMFHFLVVTHLHDLMVVISSTLSLLGLFYITIFLFRTRLTLLKFLCVICLLTFYYTLYLYGAGDWGLLAVMQKVSFISSILLVLIIEYFTRVEDFARVTVKIQE